MAIFREKARKVPIPTWTTHPRSADTTMSSCSQTHPSEPWRTGKPRARTPGRQPVERKGQWLWALLTMSTWSADFTPLGTSWGKWARMVSKTHSHSIQSHPVIPVLNLPGTSLTTTYTEADRRSNLTSCLFWGEQLLNFWACFFICKGITRKVLDK